MKMVITTNLKYEKGVNADGTKYQRTYYDEVPFEELANKAIIELRELLLELRSEERKLCPEGCGIAYQTDKVKVARYKALNDTRNSIANILAKNHILHEE